MFFASENCQCKNCTCTYDIASLVEIWRQNWQNLVQYDNIFNEKVAAAVGHRKATEVAQSISRVARVVEGWVF